MGCAALLTIIPACRNVGSSFKTALFLEKQQHFLLDREVMFFVSMMRCDWHSFDFSLLSRQSLLFAFFHCALRWSGPIIFFHAVLLCSRRLLLIFFCPAISTSTLFWSAFTLIFPDLCCFPSIISDCWNVCCPNSDSIFNCVLLSFFSGFHSFGKSCVPIDVCRAVQFKCPIIIFLSCVGRLTQPFAFSRLSIFLFFASLHVLSVGSFLLIIALKVFVP